MQQHKVGEGGSVLGVGKIEDQYYINDFLSKIYLTKSKIIRGT